MVFKKKFNKIFGLKSEDGVKCHDHVTKDHANKRSKHYEK